MSESVECEEGSVDSTGDEGRALPALWSLRDAEVTAGSGPGTHVRAMSDYFALQDDFRSAAQSMFDTLVSEHERILTKHLQLVVGDDLGTEPASPPTRPPAAAAATAAAAAAAAKEPCRPTHSDAEAGSTDSVVGEDDLKTKTEPMLQSEVEGESMPLGDWVRRVSASNVAFGRFPTLSFIEELETGETRSLTKIRERARVAEDVIEAVIAVAVFLDLISLGIRDRVSGSWWELLDTALAGIFTVELLRKTCKSSSCSAFLCGDTWRKNVFELVLVVLTWAEVLVARLNAQDDPSLLLLLARLLPVLRVSRIFHIRAFNELLMMVNGVVTNYKTLLYSLVLISLPLYCVALVLTETLGQQGPARDGTGAFGTIEASLFTVFRCFVAGDCSTADGRPVFVLLTEAYGWGYGILYCVMQFLMTFGLYNVITAIYVEKSVNATRFNELAIKRRLFQDRQYFECKVKAMLKVIWQLYSAHDHPSRRVSASRWADFDLKTVGKLQLTRGFFSELCKTPSFIAILRSLDISEADQMGLFDTLDVHGRGAIDPMSLVVGVRQLRGEARKADIVNITLMLRSVQSKLSQLEGAVAGNSHPESWSSPRGLGELHI